MRKISLFFMFLGLSLAQAAQPTQTAQATYYQVLASQTSPQGKVTPVFGAGVRTVDTAKKEITDRQIALIAGAPPEQATYIFKLGTSEMLVLDSEGKPIGKGTYQAEGDPLHWKKCSYEYNWGEHGTVKGSDTYGADGQVLYSAAADLNPKDSSQAAFAGHYQGDLIVIDQKHYAKLRAWLLSK